jgi:hypothetical protein
MSHFGLSEELKKTLMILISTKTDYGQIDKSVRPFVDFF